MVDNYMRLVFIMQNYVEEVAPVFTSVGLYDEMLFRRDDLIDFRRIAYQVDHLAIDENFILLKGHGQSC